MSTCRVCGGALEQFFDFGDQPLSDCFLRPGDTGSEFFYRLEVGSCATCAMVQLMREVPRERMFHDSYPYRSSGSSRMREHFARTATHLLATEVPGGNGCVVEIGCNDGVFLGTVAQAGVRHLGFEPSGNVAAAARAKGINVVTEFFEAGTAGEALGDDGPANVVYAANTMCHIPYVESIFRGVAEVLAPDGVFVFEDPYLGDIVAKTSYDQIYDEHYFLFSATTVRRMALRFGFDLVDVERLPVHGGEVRYTLARVGRRQQTQAVADLIAEEQETKLHTAATLEQFATSIRRNRDELVGLLSDLAQAGKTVAAYGATAKSATVTNYCGIGPDLVSTVYDSTPDKQGRLTPGVHIPVSPSEDFAEPYPDYVLLFAWNHAEEIVAKETGFRAAGGKWIHYVPNVHVSG